tara:strand:+ start:1244 stop:1393 length:150 start_codon:yes stop_codon:yes gene_type:complete
MNEIIKQFEQDQFYYQQYVSNLNKLYLIEIAKDDKLMKELKIFPKYEWD